MIRMISAGLLMACSLSTAAPAAGEPPFRIVTLGDSITKGVREGVAANDTFGQQLQRLLTEQGVSCEIINQGVGGERTDQALERLDRIIALQPRVVTIMYGANDSYVDPGQTSSRISSAAFRRNLMEIVRRLLRAGVEPVLMTSPRCAATVRPNGLNENPNVRLEAFMDECRSVAEQADVVLIDHYADWSAAENAGQNLDDWTTDGLHPNAAGHRRMAERMLPILQEIVGSSVSCVPFRVRRQVILKHDAGDFLWFHPRPVAVPAQSGRRGVLITLQKHLKTSDHYSGASTLWTADLGHTWQGPDTPPELSWVQDGDVHVAVADVTPLWHGPTERVIAIGAQVRYSPDGRQLTDRPRSHQTAYAVYDPRTQSWAPWKQLPLPPDERFDFARCACAQGDVRQDGSLLLPFYTGRSVKEPFSTVVLRCEFDGQTLSFREQGNRLELDVARGLYEPSLIRFQDHWYLTLRNDEAGYVTRSRDGLHFRPVRRWQFDDGQDLGSYNTQQHWLVLGNGLFLAYTRRGLNNDHIMRHRAPLLIAQVDPKRLHVVRSTEQILVPERGATLGNFGAASITDDEAWVTVSEGIWNQDALRRGAQGATFVARVQPDDNRPAAAPATMKRLLQGTEPVRIVCFGDSVTGLYYHTGGLRAWTDFLGMALQRACPGSIPDMINAGISGHTTAQGLDRIEQDVLSRRPDLVVVMFGLNDMVRVSEDAYRTNLEEIVRRVRKQGAEVILCTPNAVISTDDRPVPRLERFCSIVRAVARDGDVPLCDIYQAESERQQTDFDAWRRTMSDEIHPNADGHKRIAEQVARIITGKTVFLDDVEPSGPGIPGTLNACLTGQPVRILAMSPFDAIIRTSLQELFPDADIRVESWETAQRSLPELTQEAQRRVRTEAPHLVLLAPPRSAAASSREEFIRSLTWLMNWSLPFSKRDRDVVVIHPDVLDPQKTDRSPDRRTNTWQDTLFRQLVRAQDLPLVDRMPGDDRSPEAVVLRWLRRQKEMMPAE